VLEDMFSGRRFLTTGMTELITCAGHHDVVLTRCRYDRSGFVLEHYGTLAPIHTSYLVTSQIQTALTGT
jgi:hypothetical protein